MHLSVRQFFTFKFKCLLNHTNGNDKFFCSYTKEYYNTFRENHNISQKARLNDEQRDLLFKVLDDKVNTIIHIYQVLLLYEKIQITNTKNKNMQSALTLVLWFYFLSWFYILIISINTLPISEVLQFLINLTPKHDNLFE